MACQSILGSVTFQLSKKNLHQDPAAPATEASSSCDCAVVVHFLLVAAQTVCCQVVLKDWQCLAQHGRGSGCCEGLTQRLAVAG